jgi:hypothetical protein
LRCSIGFGVLMIGCSPGCEQFAASQYRLFEPLRQAERDALPRLLPPIRKSYQALFQQLRRNFNRATVD